MTYTRSVSQVKSFIEKNLPLKALAFYERVLDTYSMFFQLDSMHQKIRRLKTSNSYKGTLAARKKAFEKEGVLTELLLQCFYTDYDIPKKANLKWWNRELNKLDKIDEKGGVEMKKMLERVRFKVLVAAYQKNNSELKHSPKHQEFCDTIIAKTRSK